MAPTYTDRALSSVPNAQAMRGHVWVPGLDDAYVPQGVAFGDGAVWVATYRSADPAQSFGPCRVYRIDPASGAVNGQFDLPSECGHAASEAGSQRWNRWATFFPLVFAIDTATLR